MLVIGNLKLHNDILLRSKIVGKTVQQQFWHNCTEITLVIIINHNNLKLKLLPLLCTEQKPYSKYSLSFNFVNKIYTNLIILAMSL